MMIITLNKIGTVMLVPMMVVKNVIRERDIDIAIVALTNLTKKNAYVIVIAGYLNVYVIIITLMYHNDYVTYYIFLSFCFIYHRG